MRKKIGIIIKIVDVRTMLIKNSNIIKMTITIKFEATSIVRSTVWAKSRLSVLIRLTIFPTGFLSKKERSCSKTDLVALLLKSSSTFPIARAA